MKSILQLWSNPPALICLDRWEQGVPSGRVYLSRGQMEYPFQSLTQLLLLLDNYLNRGTLPSPTRRTRFSSPSGQIATLFFQVEFRNHASWQGKLTWQERDVTLPFASELEMINLMRQIAWAFDPSSGLDPTLVYFPKTGYNGA